MCLILTLVFCSHTTLPYAVERDGASVSTCLLPERGDKQEHHQQPLSCSISSAPFGSLLSQPALQRVNYNFPLKAEVHVDSVWSYGQSHLTISCHVSKHYTVNYGFNTQATAAQTIKRGRMRVNWGEWWWGRDIAERKYQSLISKSLWLTQLLPSSYTPSAVTVPMHFILALTNTNDTLKDSFIASVEKMLFYFQCWYRSALMHPKYAVQRRPACECMARRTTLRWAWALPKNIGCVHRPLKALG